MSDEPIVAMKVKLQNLKVADFKETDQGKLVTIPTDKSAHIVRDSYRILVNIENKKLRLFYNKMKKKARPGLKPAYTFIIINITPTFLTSS